MPIPFPVEIRLDDEQRGPLELWARTRNSAQALGLRCRIVLLAAAGLNNTEIAEELGIDHKSARKWRAWFATDGLDDLVGLYMNPPERAVALCVDHLAAGDVYGSLHARHRAFEFKKFLQTLDREVPGPLRSSSCRTTPRSTRRQPSTVGSPPTHAPSCIHPNVNSWLNLVERWFAELTNKKLRRGTHRSVRALNSDLRSWIAHGTRTPAIRLDQDNIRDPRLSRPLLRPNQ